MWSTFEQRETVLMTCSLLLHIFLEEKTQVYKSARHLSVCLWGLTRTSSSLPCYVRGVQCNMARPNAISSLPLLPEIYAQYASPPLLQINVLTPVYLVSRTWGGGIVQRHYWTYGSTKGTVLFYMFLRIYSHRWCSYITLRQAKYEY